MTFPPTKLLTDLHTSNDAPESTPSPGGKHRAEETLVRWPLLLPPHDPAGDPDSRALAGAHLTAALTALQSPAGPTLGHRVSRRHRQTHTAQGQAATEGKVASLPLSQPHETPRQDPRLRLLRDSRAHATR